MVLNREDIVAWGGLNSLRKKEMIVFLECLRNIKENDNNELILTYPSKIRFLKEGGYVECVSEFERRRLLCYYKLTDKGMNIINQLNNIQFTESDFFEIHNLFLNLNRL